ncbi:alpha-mannosidase [Anaerotaenia torta]|uniref:alpha-mannosidase n=1 Tax=Anaerotaenia torta TaxID=433293 RepID=UPI003D263336
MEQFRINEESFTRIREKLEQGVYQTVAGLSMEAYRTKEPVPYEDRKSGEYFIPKAGETWGELFDCAWFHFTGKVPEEAKGKKCVLLIDFSGEGLVYAPDGRILQGLTSTTSRNEFPLGLWGKRAVEVSDCVWGMDDTIIDIWVDAGCNDLEGQYRNDGKVKEAVIATVDLKCRELFYDWVVCQSLYVGLCENNDPYGDELAPILLEAQETLSELTPASMEKARELLQEILSRGNENPAMMYSSIGHSHLDLLFLWPQRETIRKAARTCSTVLKLMDIYPEYKFGCSQAPLYVWLKRDYPRIYDRICEKIREGRWEVQGAFWVECDTNIPSGEALVRQLLYGKEFFQKEFGLEMKIGFLPDVFGYSAALPQLLSKTETPYFMTQKMSWNDTNRFPRTTFRWQGPDGSEVLTHMPPEDSYTSAAVPQMAIYGQYHNKDLDRCKEALMLFGLGDGGGGPGYEHFERKRRMKNLKGCPPHRDEFVVDFFRRIEGDRENYRNWSGEFYLERHQGTYTSIAEIKLNNRRTEQKLHTLEWLSVLAEVRCGRPYPKERLEEIWKEILLYQFHDCLPGSSIARVYREVNGRYEVILSEIDLEIKEILELLSATLDTRSCREPVLLCNPTGFARREELTVGGRQIQAEIPAYGILLCDLADAAEGSEEAGSELVLENELVRAEFTPNGTLASLIHKVTGFDMIKEGSEGNRLCLYPDELTHWDINKDYLKAPPVPVAPVSAKGFRQAGVSGIRFRYLAGDSAIHQTVTLKEHSARIDFDTEVDWKEEYQMLRVDFPVSVLTDTAECEIQFGHVKRPTHTNTSWDEAKFEVCAHKWADLSDGGSGIALLNDCKYGYKLWNNTLDLCLLRSQNCPCEQGDRGKHRFIYSIYPHTGDVIQGGVVREGFLLNYPVIIEPAAKEAEAAGKETETGMTEQGTVIHSPVTVDCSNIVIDTIKKAQSGEGYIVRFYEAGGRRTKARITLEGYEAVSLCNLLEKPYSGCGKASLELEFQRFEVHTLLIRPSQKG